MQHDTCRRCKHYALRVLLGQICMSCNGCLLQLLCLNALSALYMRYLEACRDAMAGVKEVSKASPAIGALTG